MRNRLAISLLLSTMGALVVPIVSTEDQPTVDAISFQTSANDATATAPVTTLTAVKGGVVGRYDVVASIRNHKRSYDDYFLLASVEAIVAPKVIPPELVGQDLTTAVGWGYIATMDTLQAQVIRSIAPSDQVSRTVMILDVDEVLRRSFSDPDESLWPWAFRVTVYIVDRYGKALSHGSGVLRLNPPTNRHGGLLPNKPVNPSHSAVTALAQSGKRRAIGRAGYR